MCLATADAGIPRFDLMRQRGSCPMGMRWAASSDMSDELSHIWIDQFTYGTLAGHENFHETFEDVVVESCAKCGGMLLDGPRNRSTASSKRPAEADFEEPDDETGFRQQRRHAMVTRWTPGRRHVIATHTSPGKGGRVRGGRDQTMEMLKETAGVVGYQILKRVGLSTLGSGPRDRRIADGGPQDSSGSKLRRTAEVWEGYTIPAEYLTMVEFETSLRAGRHAARQRQAVDSFRAWPKGAEQR